MDLIEKFIRQVSYKFPKGYPDMNNEQDVQLLNTLLEGLKINLSEKTSSLTFEQCKEILLTQVNLKSDIIDEIENIYNAHPNDQKSFLKNFFNK